MLIGQIPTNLPNPDELFDTSQVSPWDPLFAVGAVIAGIVIGRIARGIIRSYGRRVDMPPNLVDLFGTVAIWVTFGIATLIALSLVGFDVAPIWMVFIVLAIIFAVSGRGFLENFGAGVQLQTRSPFVPGDQINTIGIDGTVEQVNSRVVVINTIDGRQVFVPNATVLRNPIVTYTSAGPRMSALDVGVAYGTDLGAAVEVIQAALAPLATVEDDPAPTVLVQSFDESAIRITVRFWHSSRIQDEWQAKHDVVTAIETALDEVGIVIAFPQVTVWRGETQAEPADE